MVKRVLGGAGRGANVVLGDIDGLPPAPPIDGPFLLQQFIPNDGTVAKVYVIGTHLHGTAKHYGNDSTARATGTPLIIDPALERSARRVGASTGLELFGFDVVPGENGPCVIDVNVFPVYRDVPRAPKMIATYLLDLNTLPREV